jgi:RNA polymerase sigma factor (sigma-70 family)
MLKERIERLERSLKRVWSVPIFKDRTKHPKILGPIPDHEQYLADKAKVLELRKTANPAYLPCYEEPLLTREQECHLFRQFNFFKYWALVSFKRRRFLDAERMLKKSEEPRGILVAANCRLTVNKAKSYIKTPDFDDILLEGFFLTNKAIDYFDWRRGFKFSTFLTCTMNQTLFRTAKDFGTHRQRYYSAEATDDQFEEVDTFDFDVNIEKAERNELAGQLLQHAHKRERTVLILRFFGEMTLDEVSQQLGVSKERVRQIQQDGIGRINKAVALRPELCYA